MHLRYKKKIKLYKKNTHTEGNITGESNSFPGKKRIQSCMAVSVPNNGLLLRAEDHCVFRMVGCGSVASRWLDVVAWP